MRIGVIYCLISPSGKRYVGQSWNYKLRIKYYKNMNCKDQPKLYNALVKYGFERFEYKIIDYCENQIEMDNKEIWYIQEYDCIKNGYNCRSGGESHKIHSDETKRKISETKLRNGPTLKQIQSKHFKGQNHSQAAKTTISTKNKLHWSNQSFRNKMLNSKKKYQYIFHKENSDIKIQFSNLHECAKVMKLGLIKIREIIKLKGISKYNWYFVDKIRIN